MTGCEEFWSAFYRGAAEEDKTWSIRKRMNNTTTKRKNNLTPQPEVGRRPVATSNSNKRKVNETYQKDDGWANDYDEVSNMPFFVSAKFALYL